MYEVKYSIVSIKKEDHEDYFQIMIKKESSSICLKNYYIKDSAYGREFIYSLKNSSDQCKYVYENFNGNTWFEIGISLMTSKYVITVLPINNAK